MGRFVDQACSAAPRRDGRRSSPRRAGAIGRRCWCSTAAATDARCGGAARSAMGPFYCPDDQKVYLDTSFFDQIATRFRGCDVGSKACQFSEAYVIAHEIGHHVQNQLGILSKAQQAQRVASSRAEANHIQVRVELQADCLAGVWANRQNEYLKSQGKPPFIEPGDVEAALRTAAAIGDDTLQRRSQGYVVPDSFTHGSSEQRQRWFETGFRSGSRAELQHLRLRSSCERAGCPGIDQSREFVPLKIAVLTVSDTRELADDKSGATWSSASRRRGTRCRARASCPTTSRESASAIKKWIADPAIDVIITTGGTGFTGRDVTPEAIEPCSRSEWRASRACSSW